MGKAELKEYIAEQTGITPFEAGIVINVMITGMSEALKKEGKLTLTNFGSFRVKESKARIARNPRTGETVQVPDRKVVRFKIAGKLKDLISK